MKKRTHRNPRKSLAMLAKQEAVEALILQRKNQEFSTINLSKLPKNQKGQQFFLSSEGDDRVTYIYQLDLNNDVSEVINVSYETLIKGRWKTLCRYDSEHGFLHRHSILKSGEPITNTVGVIKKGDSHDWLTWAVKDVSKRYLNYKKGYINSLKKRKK